MNSHYDALKKLFPVPDLAGCLDDDLGIEGKYLDSADASAATLLQEMFPDTCDSTMLQSFSTMTDSTDLAGVLYKFGNLKKKSGWMNPDYYVEQANRYGLDATVTEGLSEMFRVGITSPPATLLPAALYDSSHIWTWRLDTSGYIDSTGTVMQLFTHDIIEAAPAWTQVTVTYQDLR